MEFKTKKEIREFVKKKRDEIREEDRKAWDERIFSHLISSSFYKNAKVIFVFVSFGSEVDTHRIIHRALADNKVVGVPRIPSKERGIEVYRIEGFHDLEERYYKILEPKEHCSPIAPEEIDLILMPGLAFDLQGGRVGYGAGFYDRFLHRLQRPVDKIALAYQFQVFDKVPFDAFDVRIDGIITEEGVKKCSF